MSAQKGTARRPAPTYGDDQLRTLQRNTFRYFWEETNPQNGLIPDHTSTDDVPASIAGVGFALASYPVAVERSFLPRAKAVERTLATLRFFWEAPQGPMPDATVSHGWKPETGFLRHRWQGYNEALILYVLGLGSPTHRLPEKSYPAWTSTYRWKKLHGHEFLYGAPLFMHQLSQVWIDFRGDASGERGPKALSWICRARRAVWSG